MMVSSICYYTKINLKKLNIYYICILKFLITLNLTKLYMFKQNKIVMKKYVFSNVFFLLFLYF